MARNDLPQPSANNFNQRLRETIQTYLGRQGDPLDRGLTLRDLIDAGVVKFKSGFGASSGSGGSLNIDPVNTGGGTAVEVEPDLTPPPQPSGFFVSAAISHVFVEHDDPIYTQGHGHLRTHVYGAIVEAGDPLPTFAAAVDVGQFSGSVWAMPSNPATTWRLWIKWETEDGVLSPTPAGGTNGLQAVTGQDVSLLLDALEGQITESQLFSDLGDRINLVDGSGLGSVNQRLAAEALERSNEIQEAASQSAEDLLAEVTARTSADSALQTQINTLTAASSGDFQALIAALQEEQTARIDGDAAEASSRQTLAAQMRGAYTGTDVTSLTAGLLFSERQARAGADAAMSQDITALSSTVQTNKTSIEAALTTEASTRANADGAMASQIATLTSTVNGNTAAIETEATARANADNTLFAKYTVKVDVNGYVSGFGLASTANNGATVSDFAIRADKFYIANPAGPGVAPAMPFIVQTTATTIGGVSVPVGVYMNDAFIQNGTITNAKIANLAVDDAKIANLNVGKLKAGSITTGEYIQSTGYVAGTSGWRINGSGLAEFSAASIRGQLTASQIDGRGLSIKDASGNVILAAGSPLAAANVSGLGSLATANYVSTSQVLGLGSLATKNSVNWNSELLNIPAFGNFAYLSSITSANIGTYIASAAIGNAYISDLNAAKLTAGTITAEKINSNSLSKFTLFSFDSNAFSIPVDSSGYTQQTITEFNVSLKHGKKVVVNFSCNIDAYKTISAYTLNSLLQITILYKAPGSSTFYLGRGVASDAFIPAGNNFSIKRTVSSILVGENVGAGVFVLKFTHNQILESVSGTRGSGFVSFNIVVSVAEHDI